MHPRAPIRSPGVLPFKALVVVRLDPTTRFVRINHTTINGAENHQQRIIWSFVAVQLALEVTPQLGVSFRCIKFCALLGAHDGTPNSGTTNVLGGVTISSMP